MFEDTRGLCAGWLLAGAFSIGLALAAGCDKKEPGKSDESAAKAPPSAAEDKTAAPVKVESPPAVEPETANAEAAPKSLDPAATPARESLELLAEKGSNRVSSIRQERKSIYRLFGAFTPEQQKDVAGAVAEAQKIRWDDRPEKLGEIPEQIHGAIRAILPLSAKYSDAGAESLRAYAELQKEAEGGKKINQKKADKLQEQGSADMKVGRNLGLLIRSLFDEARVFAEFGSVGMRKQMRESFGAMKDQPLPIDQAELGLQKLLYELNVEGVEAPALD